MLIFVPGLGGDGDAGQRGSLLYCILVSLYNEVENFPCGADAEDFIIMWSPIFGTIAFGVYNMHTT